MKTVYENLRNKDSIKIQVIQMNGFILQAVSFASLGEKLNKYEL